MTRALLLSATLLIGFALGVWFDSEKVALAEHGADEARRWSKKLEDKALLQLTVLQGRVDALNMRADECTRR